MKQLILKIDVERTKSTISPEIYGQFSEHLGRCIYEGIYVGEDSKIPNVRGMRKDVVDALKEIHLPVLRWPGGCFADEYHWRDGIGAKEERRRIVNTNWGGVVENNHFGTHEFMDLCEQIGCEPYIALNMGSGTVQEAAEWIEYMTYDGDSELAKLRKRNGQEKPWKLKYIGVGNESWGCGGSMEPGYYADCYRHYRTFCRNLSGNELFPVACGPNGEDYHWTDVIMSRIKNHASAISLHYYTLPTGDWEHKGSATEFDEKEYYQTICRTLRMEEILDRHLKIMDYHDPEQKVALIVDEWGTWYDVEPGTNPGFLYQQNTMRDAIVAAINLNIFNKHSDRVIMANIAQVVNVLQAMLLTEGMNIVKTPTYSVLDMFQSHQGAVLVDSVLVQRGGKAQDGAISGSEAPTSGQDGVSVVSGLPVSGCEGVTVPSLSESVSLKTGEDGSSQTTITLSNASLTESYEIKICLPIGQSFSGTAEITTLSGAMNAHNTFEAPDTLCPRARQEHWDGGEVTLTIPPCAVVSVVCPVTCAE